MEWVKENYWTFYTEEVFNGYIYRLTIWVYSNKKSVKFWIGVSSGKKRKEKDIFENKKHKSLGGIKALIWLKNKMYEFPKIYNEYYPFEKGKNQYLQIHWADSRRRDIYQRLEKEGFQFIMDEGKKILMKKIKND